MNGSHQDHSVLGSDVRLEGILSFTDTVHLNGDFTGNIFAGGSLVIGEKGRIRADINVSSLISSGEIVGNIVATERVKIRAPGKVIGDITAPAVVIENGALFEGCCHHPDSDSSRAVCHQRLPGYENPIRKIA